VRKKGLSGKIAKRGICRRLREGEGTLLGRQTRGTKGAHRATKRGGSLPEGEIVLGGGGGEAHVETRADGLKRKEVKSAEGRKNHS